MGIAVPATLNDNRTRVVRCVNLPFLEDVPLADLVHEQLNVMPILVTDAEAAAWAEYHALDSRPRSFAHLRLGTGVACGIVRDGRLIRLDLNRTHHLEALCVDESASALHCPCGLRGCLETIASGPAIIRAVSIAGLADANRDRHSEPRTPALDAKCPGSARANVPGESGDDHQNRDRKGADIIAANEYDAPHDPLRKLNDKCHDGDTAALAVLHRVANAVRRAADHLHQTYGVSVIGLGGGVCRSLPILLNRLCDPSDVSDASDGATPVALTRAALGDRAGVIGAARLAVQHEAVDRTETNAAP
jgi:predicted NBD/HSP70 family sugar kinase